LQRYLADSKIIISKKLKGNANRLPEWFMFVTLNNVVQNKKNDIFDQTIKTNAVFP